MYKFEKHDVPGDEEKKMEFCGKLVVFGVSLKNYVNGLTQDDITM